MSKLDELYNKKKELMAQVDAADAELFAELKTQIEKVDLQIAEEEKNEENERKKASVDAETRAARVPNGTNDNVTLFDTSKTTRSETTMSKEQELRFAKIGFAKQVRSQLTGKTYELTPNEKRALGVAVATTSTTFTAPSESADGVNNGGIFIPQTVLYDLLEMDEVDSPFLRDAKPTHIKGATIFPYVAESSNGSTKGKKETVAADERSIKWDKLTLAQGNYPLTIAVTMELLAMTDEEFANYLLADLGNEINMLLADESLYGTGKDDNIEGVTVGAIAGTA
ncbi:MAG: phage major capsid protein, partial [Clostridia bacterium]|nr:phage major capsid protein [Clostridia bacterium]